MKHLLLSYKAILGMALTMVLFSACQKKTVNPNATEKKSITRLVSQTPNLSFLEAAVIKAGLATTLDQPGTYT